MAPTATSLPATPCSAAARAIALLVLALLGTVPIAAARTAPGALSEVAVAELPREAQELLVLIGRGGPFRFDRDGIVFGNREQILPARPRAYYREYTVRTPGVRGRGARRVICGGPAKAPDACFYTDDHYQSFRSIRK